MPPHDHAIAWAHRDDADALDPAPTLGPADRRFGAPIVLAAFCIGVLFSAGLAFTHHAPRCVAFLPITDLRP